MVELATTLVICSWSHMIFILQKVVALVLVSTTSFASVIRGRYHHTLRTIVWLFEHFVCCLFHKTLVIVWQYSSSTNCWNKIHKRLTKFCQLFSFAISFWFLTNVWQIFSAWNLVNVWRKYWQVPISQMFHEIFAIIFLLRFCFIVTTSLYHIEWNKIFVCEVHAAFFCASSIYVIYWICCLLFRQSSIFFYWEQCWKESNGWKNVL